MNKELEDLKENLDDKVGDMTGELGQKRAEQMAKEYLEQLTLEEKLRMEPVFKQLLECKQEEFYKLWYPVVDLCLTKSYKVYNHVDRSLGYIDQILKKLRGNG